MGVERELTKATALKKLTSNVERHSAGSASAIRVTGDSVPWLIMRPSRVENAFNARATAFGPTCNKISFSDME